ncbi:MAG: MFS transporter [Chloroflexia bacterium]
MREEIVRPNPPRSSSRVWPGRRSYLSKLRRFQANARLYLLSMTLAGIGYGIFRLLFNFFVLSFRPGNPRYDENLLGQLVMASSLAALAGALPAGYLADRLGRKPSLLLSSAAVAAAVVSMVLWPTPTNFFLMHILQGLAQSLGAVTAGPFLMENSGEEERTYLFSFQMGLQALAGSLGNWFGGNLPTWLGEALGVAPTSTPAYTASLLLVGGLSFLSLLPLLCLRRGPAVGSSARRMLSPFQYLRKNPVLLGKLIGPEWIISLGAGLLIPFMNVFYRRNYSQPDATIGTLFALGSLAMGIGLLLAPLLADRWPKMRVVVATQALSIPFLVLLGFAPSFYLSAAAYLIRVALMNMSNPVYTTFVMEQVEPEARATVSSLTSIGWNFGWALSPWVSGWLQTNYGFAPVFAGTISSYVIAIAMMWRFFWHRRS